MLTWSWSRPRLVQALIALPLVVVAAWGIGTLLAAKDAEAIRAAFILSGLMLFSLLLFWVVSRSDPLADRLFAILIISFLLKLGAMAYRFYGGLLADALVYNAVGQRIAEELARGELPAEFGNFGTSFIRVAAGFVYYATGVTFSGISILWTWFGLLGMLFFYLAFRTAFPSGNHRLYMLLIFLYPSVLLWTSSLGKDALMMLFTGMAAFGTARLHRRLELIGIWWLGLGIAGMLMIRPHVAAMFSVAAGASFLIRPVRVGMLSPALRLLGILTVAVLAVVIVNTAGGYVGLESLDTQGVFGFIEEFQEQSERGGGAFEQVDPRSPAGLALAIPTILFRPFPWEAHNQLAYIASLEGLVLLVLILYRFRSVLAAMSRMFREGYLLLTGVYAVLFIFFYSAIANFGIIARQRVQLFPFVFMWIAYLASRRRSVEEQP